MKRILLILAFLTRPLFAHELWIEPSAYIIQPNQMLEATLKNGQNFEGISLAWFNSRQVLFDWSDGDTRSSFEGRAGDIPTVSLMPSDEGLLVLIYQSAPQVVDYDDWESFQRFLDHKDLNDVAQAHQSRGLPEAGFDEVYSRFAKSLIAVGDGAGLDEHRGLEYELVALNNPYTDDVFKVQLLYNGELRGDAQIEVYDRDPDGNVTVSLTRTDERGVAEIPVRAGHSYLVDSVLMRVPSDTLARQTGAVWETLWASLTFAVPR